jgi:hypothetical protein
MRTSLLALRQRPHTKPIAMREPNLTRIRGTRPRDERAQAGLPPVIAGTWLPSTVRTHRGFAIHGIAPSATIPCNSCKMAVRRQKARIFGTFSDSEGWGLRLTMKRRR